MRPVLLVAGTRPEGIKIASVYFALRKANIPVQLCATSQHDQLLAEVFSIFNMTPDIDLRVMQAGQDLFYLTSELITRMKTVLQQVQPSVVLVQGDTTSAMAAGLAAFYMHIPVGHIEAGLRTGDLQAPYPEEFNRCMLGKISTYHFAPTSQAAAHLMSEGHSQNKVFCVGNTVVDALRLMKEKIEKNQLTISSRVHGFFAQAANNKTVLFTMHRRESFGKPLHSMLGALKNFACNHPEVRILYPYHPNPQVTAAIEGVDLAGCSNITLLPPIAYQDLVYALLHVTFVVTDSGGIQEEAVSLGKRVIVLREKSERMEGVWHGLAVLMGYDTQRFEAFLEKELLQDATTEEHRMVINNVYGDGFAAEKIVRILQMYALQEEFFVGTSIAHEAAYEAFK